MMRFDRISLGRQAKKMGFVRDTFEKVCRLTDVLSFMENDPLLSETLALKGGTAINLTIFDLPRLSVDIDMDYTKNAPREGMLEERNQINAHLSRYMSTSGYSLSTKSKQYHALDSFVYEYTNAAGMKDNLKIEINYMLRCHIFPVIRRAIVLPWDTDNLTVLSVDPMEVFSAKTVALLNRSAARDLYDLYNLQKNRLFDESQNGMFKKCILFYTAIASEKVPDHYTFDGIRKITAQKVKTDLMPVLRSQEHFELSEAQEKVENYLSDLLLPEGDISFLNTFAQSQYKPELLFDDPVILSRIEQHPMALWKCRGYGEKSEQ